MTRLFSTRARQAALLALVLGLSACSSLRDTAQSAATLGGLLTPYKIDVVQGNVITKEQVEALRNGMTRIEVRDVLGTPLLQSMFHADRWDYVFSFRRGGQTEQVRRLAVFFDGNTLQRVEADPMPTETEFVASIVPKRISGKEAVMDADEAQLKAFAAKNEPARAATSQPANPAATTATAYPPLEPSRPGAAR